MFYIKKKYTPIVTTGIINIAKYTKTNHGMYESITLEVKKVDILEEYSNYLSLLFAQLPQLIVLGRSVHSSNF